jgi:hypothetical protein
MNPRETAVQPPRNFAWSTQEDYTPKQRRLVQIATYVPLVVFIGFAAWVHSVSPSHPHLNPSLLFVFVGGLSLAHFSAALLFSAGWRRRQQEAKQPFTVALFACAAILEVEVLLVFVAALARFLSL